MEIRLRMSKGDLRDAPPPHTHTLRGSADPPLVAAFVLRIRLCSKNIKCIYCIHVYMTTYLQ